VYAVVFVDAWLLRWMKCLVVDVVDVFLEEYKTGVIDSMVADCYISFRMCGVVAVVFPLCYSCAV
jgi:hypothetical protein